MKGIYQKYTQSRKALVHDKYIRVSGGMPEKYLKFSTVPNKICISFVKRRTTPWNWRTCFRNGTYNFGILAKINVVIFFFKLYSLGKVSDRKNSILLNPLYSGIFIRTKQFHSDLTQSRAKDFYPDESEVKLRIPIRFNPKLKQECQSNWIRPNLILE